MFCWGIVPKPHALPHRSFLKNFFFFNVGPVLKSLLNFLQYCFCLLFRFFAHETCGMWDLRSLTRDRTCTHPLHWKVKS